MTTVRLGDPLGPQCVDLCVGWVMARCSLTTPRIRGVLSAALVAYAKLHGEPLREIAVLMAGNYAEYQAMSLNLAYKYGPAKFFGEGHWCQPNTWRWDKEAKERLRQRW